MSLLFNMLSRLVITFLPRSKRLLISWLQSPSTVIVEPKKMKSDTVSTVSPSISHEVIGPDAMILVFWMLRTARRSNQSILKEISPRCSLEGLMLKLKLQYLATSCEELTHWKRPWCWEALGPGGEGGNRGWDGWMASLTQWAWVWVSSGSW